MSLRKVKKKKSICPKETILNVKAPEVKSSQILQ